jgi:AGZA family xanthine/uracil permease-like MFS transporter
VITAVMMPLTYSIAEGIAIGFLSYAAIKVVSGKAKDVNISVYVIAAFALLKYIWL